MTTERSTRAYHDFFIAYTKMVEAMKEMKKASGVPADMAKLYDNLKFHNRSLVMHMVQIEIILERLGWMNEFPADAMDADDLMMRKLYDCAAINRN